MDGYEVCAKALKACGIQAAFGVMGIPITPLGTALQALGIRFVGTHNEQSAGYAACAFAFVTGHPAALISVSGPGVVHALAGAAHAQANCLPLVCVSGSCPRGLVARGAFQELDQVNAFRPYTKFAASAPFVSEIPRLVRSAVSAAINGRPGAAYIDIPSDVLHEKVEPARVTGWLEEPAPQRALQEPGRADLARAVEAIRLSKKPLLVIGKGAALARAENEALAIVDGLKLPFLPTPMGRGVVSDSHPLCAGAARSAAIGGTDLAIVVGARMNWILHFGEAPRWDAGCKFIRVDVSGEDACGGAHVAASLIGDAGASLAALLQACKAAGVDLSGEERDAWRKTLSDNATKNTASLEKKIATAIATADPSPTSQLKFMAALGVIRTELARVQDITPVVVAEGANTMDIARTVVPVNGPRTRLDAGSWGTMGLGLGYALAAGVANPKGLVVDLEGDSAFGFSGMEVETMVRFKLPVVVVVFENGGIYGGVARAPQEARSMLEGDPAPLELVRARYDQMMSAFGGDSYHVNTTESLAAACKQAFSKRSPALINIVIDATSGVESGSMQSHN